MELSSLFFYTSHDLVIFAQTHWRHRFSKTLAGLFLLFFRWRFLWIDPGPHLFQSSSQSIAWANYKFIPNIPAIFFSSHKGAILNKSLFSSKVSPSSRDKYTTRNISFSMLYLFMINLRFNTLAKERARKRTDLFLSVYLHLNVPRISFKIHAISRREPQSILISHVPCVFYIHTWYGRNRFFFNLNVVQT